jgi:hypothetical protein
MDSRRTSVDHSESYRNSTSYSRDVFAKYRGSIAMTLEDVPFVKKARELIGVIIYNRVYKYKSIIMPLDVSFIIKCKKNVHAPNASKGICYLIINRSFYIIFLLKYNFVECTYRRRASSNSKYSI